MAYLATDQNDVVGRQPARGPHVMDIVVIASVVLVAVGYWTGVAEVWGVPKRAVGLLVVPLGLVCLARLASSGDVAAQIAGGLLGWMALCAWTSSTPSIALLGTQGRHESWLTWAACIGVWAMARGLSDRGRVLLGAGLVFGALTSGLVGFAQFLFEPADWRYGLDLGRPTGLAGSAPFLGLATTAALAFVVSSQWVGASTRATNGTRLVIVAALASFGTLSSSRIALVLLVAFAGFSLTRGLLRRCVPDALTGGTIALSVVLATVAQAWRGSRPTSGRLTVNGLEDRLLAWELALRASAHRPLFGWGPGRFTTAVDGWATDNWVRRFPDDSVQVWDDAHNLFVGMLLNAGVPGLVLILVFLAVSRRGTGPFAVFAIVSLLALLLEPSNIVVVFPALAALGASMPIADHSDSCGRLGAGFAVLGVVAGIAMSGTYLWSYHQAWEIVRSPSAEGEPALWASRDPVVHAQIAESRRQQRRYVAAGNGAAAAVPWLQRAVTFDETNPRWWSRLSEAEWKVGNLDRARELSGEALGHQRNHVRALTVLHAVAGAEGNVAEQRLIAAQLDRIGIDRERCRELSSVWYERLVDGSSIAYYCAGSGLLETTE